MLCRVDLRGISEEEEQSLEDFIRHGDKRVEVVKCPGIVIVT